MRDGRADLAADLVEVIDGLCRSLGHEHLLVGDQPQLEQAVAVGQVSKETERLTGIVNEVSRTATDQASAAAQITKIFAIVMVVLYFGIGTTIIFSAPLIPFALLSKLIASKTNLLSIR